MSAATLPTTQSLCPECHHHLVSEDDKVPWCERCEWNLEAPDLDPHLGRFERFRGRLAHEIGYDLTRGLFDRLVGRSAQRPGLGLAFAVLLVISTLVMAVFLAALGVSGWLLWNGNVIGRVGGVLLLCFTWVFRPRLGSVRESLKETDELTEEQAPHLYALIRRVAEAVGTPMPHRVALNPAFNAKAGTIGLSRRRLMVLGLPMLAVLRPQERVALIGHELGHFVNHNSRRFLTTQPALTAFGTAARLVNPRGITDSLRRNPDFHTRLALFGFLFIYPVMWALASLLWLSHLGINMIGTQVSQRAEYFADDLAAQAAGSAAEASQLDVFIIARGVSTVIGARSRTGERAAGWREGVEKSRAATAERLNRLRQLSIRSEAGIFTSHPPTGLRHRMIMSAPYRTAAVVLTSAESAAIDAELAGFEERYRHEIAASW